MNKKVSGAAAAAIGALLFGASQVFDHEARIQALEDAAGIGDEEAQPESDQESRPESELSDADQLEADAAAADAQPLIEANEAE